MTFERRPDQAIWQWVECSRQENSDCKGPEKGALKKLHGGLSRFSRGQMIGDEVREMVG